MAETDIHARCIIDVRFMLETYFAADPNVYVSGNLLLYFQEGDPRQSIAPDVFVVRGIAKAQRRVYKLWEERVAPLFVLEVTSRGTRFEDIGVKRGLYESIGVQEYVLFDPLEEYLRPAFQAYFLADGRFEQRAASAQGMLLSDALGLELHRRGDQLRLYDPKRDEWLRTPAEAEAARQQAETARQQAETARQQAEAARQTAEAARDAETAARRAAEARAAQAEAELARLRAALSARGQAPEA
jgi:Uma2 family endonuclease